MPYSPSCPISGSPGAGCFARSRTIIADSVLAFLVGEEVVDGGLDRDGEAVQLAAQCPTCPQRRHLVALALEAADPL